MYILETELPKYDTLVHKKPIIAHNSEQFSYVQILKKKFVWLDWLD